MKIKETVVSVNDYLTKSNLPASDYVINPYIGCPNGCMYCYACFMKRFTGHTEDWGTFVDVKMCEKPISAKKLYHKSIFLSSVTDCYNPLEEKYCVTQAILKQLTAIDCSITISTKSSLILRDMELLRQCRNLKVALSVNTLDERFREDMDHASSIQDRLFTLKKLHEAGIHTVLFLSPIFPSLTDCKGILEKTRSYVDEVWLENLNLRGSYKHTILDYIKQKHADLYEEYQNIFVHGQNQYWERLAVELENYCNERHIRHTNYFYHKKLVQKKREHLSSHK